MFFDMMKTLFVLFFLKICWSVVLGQQCNNGANCIALELCSGLYSQLQQAPSPQLSQLLRHLHCGFERNNKPKICCAQEYLGFSRNGGENPTTSLLPNTNVCGLQDSADRIVGGTQVELDEHPWMALLRYDKPRGFGYYCGGVLISSRYVLTAAHCVKGQDLPYNWRLSQVRLGEWNTSSTRDCTKSGCSDPPVDVAVERIIAHENYDPANENQHNDIALLRLSNNVRFTDYVKPICLPLNERRSTFEGYGMEVAGWGKTESKSESDVKLKVTVPVVSQSECRNVFGRVNRRIVDTQICAGGLSGKDSCRGDSGGSLMAYSSDNRNWMAVGVVSYGPSPCGTKGWPGVYTRVGSYIDWILNKLEE